MENKNKIELDTEFVREVGDGNFSSIGTSVSERRIGRKIMRGGAR